AWRTHTPSGRRKATKRVKQDGAPVQSHETSSARVGCGSGKPNANFELAEFDYRPPAPRVAYHWRSRSRFPLPGPPAKPDRTLESSDLHLPLVAGVVAGRGAATWRGLDAPNDRSGTARILDKQVSGAALRARRLSRRACVALGGGPSRRPVSFV